ncbi:OmpA family protein [Acidovorax kalamii]|uniref:OmpA family protein n=1 Tax=Acidovorax kalamii TaxID=2004485 RepID=UPI00338F0E63
MNFVQRRHLISPLLACGALFAGQIAQAGGPTSQQLPHRSPTAFSCSMRHYGSVRDVFFPPLGVVAPANERASVALLKQRADEFAQDKVCCPVVGWWIDGHADPREASTEQAEQLSQARTDYIRRLVVGLGVPAANICMRAHGARQPVSEPPSPKNIRVEMSVDCLNPHRPFCE